MKAVAAGTESSEVQHLINLSWLVRLRWGAVVGQLVTIAVVHELMAIPLPLAPLIGLVSLEAMTNVVALLWLRSGRPVREWMLPLALGTDVLILTGLLFFTGGPFNPFSFLYLVHIALAAVVLRAAWTWALVALSVASSGALFYGHVWLELDYSDPASHQQHMRMHLEGMWIAFAVAAGFIVYFVTRTRRALARREADLEAERAVAARNERLASLATLSAGAAHELATPLGTIAVVVRELERRATHGTADSLEDLRLIRGQVDRCRAILDQMAADAGTTAGEGLVPARISELVAAAVRELPRTPMVAISYAGASDVEVCAPARSLTQALRGIVKNAQEVSGQDGAVAIKVEHDPHELRIAVQDNGPGMPQDVLARAGEPFFTTKAPGRGMGLGLFLARAVVERLGGRLGVQSSPGKGTSVSVRLPLDGATKRRMVGTL